MFNIVKKSLEWGGRTLEIETGRVARQADGAVLVSYGNTKLLCTVVAKADFDPNLDFFPLTVIYQEKYSASGRLPGGFIKRENRPSEREVLTSRLIDRPIRPMFEEGFKADTQIICTVLQHDEKTDSQIPAFVGASAALAVSGLPFNGPIAASQVALIDGEFVLNPEVGFEANTELDLVISGTKSSVLMVESEAKELSEEKMLEAVNFAHDAMQPVIEMIEELGKEAGKERRVVEIPDNSALEAEVNAIATAGVTAAYQLTDKMQRYAKLDETKKALFAALDEKLGEGEYDSAVVGGIFKNLQKNIVRTSVLETKKRIDGRNLDEVRPIVPETDFLPLNHGSALFTRGETQAIVSVTLGGESQGQRFDGVLGEGMENFLLHYNFPPYSVGEASPLRAPGRREIGHGKLAWRALKPLMPSKEEFDYTVRVVSDITESNGSSSMATVCGTSLALMDAGVPIKAGCSGIAMGLIKEGDNFAVLSDILGDEDHLGDMDFKVAGSKNGITSLQMDIKIQGITKEIMKIALEQANAGRGHILNVMEEVITTPRGELKDSAPKVTKVKVKQDKIRELIGPGGKVIKDMCAQSGATINIDDDGTVSILSTSAESKEKALQMIDDIAGEAEIGKVYHDATVMNVVDFGAFVEYKGKLQALVHVSEIADERVENVSDHLKEGQKIDVKCIDIDNKGRVKLSIKQVKQAS